MTKIEAQIQVYKALQKANNMLEQGERYVVPNLRSEDGESPLYRIYSQEDARYDFLAIVKILETVSDEFLSEYLIGFKKTKQADALDLLRLELMKKLGDLGFAGFIKEIDVTFKVSTKPFRIILWPNGQLKSPRVVPPVDQFLPQERCFFWIGEGSKSFFEMQLSAKWNFDLGKIILSMNVADISEVEVTNVSGKFITQIGQDDLVLFKNSSQRDFDLNQATENEFIKLSYALEYNIVNFHDAVHSQTEEVRQVLRKLINLQSLTLSDRKLLSFGEVKAKAMLELMMEKNQGDAKSALKKIVRDNEIDCVRVDWTGVN